MALSPCPECKKNVSDKAMSCPNCGMVLRTPQAAKGGVMTARIVVALALAAAAVVVVFALRRGKSDYERVEQLRAEQDAEGSHTEHVKQRFYRLYKKHPKSAMYIYLWARCVEDAAQQLALAEEGIQADPRFSWNYNMAARALARQNKVTEAYDDATKGAQLDPGNMQLAQKVKSLKLILDNKLADEPKPAPTPAYVTYDSKESFDKGAARYKGLFRAVIRSPERSDMQAAEKARAADYKGALSDAVQGFMVCSNPYADTCVRVYAARDARFKTAWNTPATNPATLKENQLVTVAGAVVTNPRGENIMLADAVTVEAEK